MLDSNGAPPPADTNFSPPTNGAASAASNGAASSNGHANGAGGAALDSSFWQFPVNQARFSDVFWHPPLPAHRSSQEATTELINEIARAHSDADSGWGGEAKPYQGWYLRWFFETRAQAAQRELDDVVAEVRSTSRSYASLIREARASSALSRHAADEVLRHEASAHESSPEAAETTLDAMLARARHDFTDAAALAGLYVETSESVPASTSDAASAGAATRAGHISPCLVEEALDRTAPSTPEIAGMHHLRYPQSEWHGDNADSQGGLQRFFAGLSSLALSVAPLVLGLMVALCLGSVSGLLDIEDLTRRPDAAKVFKFVLAVALGGVIVTVLGKGMEATIRTLFDHLSTPFLPSPSIDASEQNGFRSLEAFRAHTPPAPRRRRVIVAGCVLLLLAFAIAEAVAEGTGLKTLNDLRIANMSQVQQRQYNASPIPLWVFYLVGALFSGAYLYYKGTDTWRKSELETMKPWLARQRQEWFERQRSQPSVQALFQLAYLVEQMEAKREELRLRLDNARASAVSEAELMHAMVEWVVYSHGQMPMPTLHLVRSFGLDESGPEGRVSNGASAAPAPEPTRRWGAR
jgi:uncharacterized protein YukE